MLSRYTFDFDKQIWRNTRYSIRSKGTTSIWYKFLYAIFAFFTDPLYPIINWIYNQIFIEYADYETLKKIGKNYDLHAEQGESADSYRARLRTYKGLLKSLLSISLCKNIFRIYLNVEAEITQGINLDVFTIGVTPLGEGVCVHSLYYRFVWKAVIPNLSESTVDRDKIMDILENFNIPSNEIIVIENRSTGEYEW